MNITFIIPRPENTSVAFMHLYEHLFLYRTTKYNNKLELQNAVLYKSINKRSSSYDFFRNHSHFFLCSFFNISEFDVDLLIDESRNQHFTEADFNGERNMIAIEKSTLGSQAGSLVNTVLGSKQPDPMDKIILESYSYKKFCDEIAIIPSGWLVSDNEGLIIKSDTSKIACLQNIFKTNSVELATLQGVDNFYIIELPYSEVNVTILRLLDTHGLIHDMFKPEISNAKMVLAIPKIIHASLTRALMALAFLLIEINNTMLGVGKTSDTFWLAMELVYGSHRQVHIEPSDVDAIKKLILQGIK